jgi:hypothetical protein
VRYLDLGGLGGGVVLGGLYLAAAGRNPKGEGLVGATAVGVAAGLTTAWFATNGMPQDRIDPGDAASPAMSASIVPTTGGAMLVARGEL